MGIVGVNSTAGREVKFIDPSKTTKSESSWLGYTLCDYSLVYIFFFYTHTHNDRDFLSLSRVLCNFFCALRHTSICNFNYNTYTHPEKLLNHTHNKKNTHIYTCVFNTLYNEERRLGDQRGSDTLVVPLITSNDGLSIAFILV